MTSPDRKIVTPTVGRKVWFRPNGAEYLRVANSEVASSGAPFVSSPDQPLDATVVYVHGNSMVNLAINDHNGFPFIATSVPLLQEGDLRPTSGYYCEWMPYQTAQAKKEQAANEAVGISNCWIGPSITPLPFVFDGSQEKFGTVSIDSAIEQQIQAAGADKAPRVTPADIEAEVAAEYGFTLDKALHGCPLVEGMDRVTLAVVVLKNGTKLVGVNYGAIDPAQHSAAEGMKAARADAIEQAWPLFGFRLRDKLSEAKS